MSTRISNSRKIPGPKKRELGGNTVFVYKVVVLKCFHTLILILVLLSIEKRVFILPAWMQLHEHDLDQIVV